MAGFSSSMDGKHMAYQSRTEKPRGMTDRCTSWWSRVAGVTALVLFIAAWSWGAAIYGGFVLPTPAQTAARLVEMISNQQLGVALWDSARRAFIGFALALLAGTVLGVVAGLSKILRSAFKPLVIICMGVPPIAWIVLALLWFGMGDGTPVFTVFISTFPLLFVNALAGMSTQDARLQALAQVLELKPWQRLMDMTLPHLAAYIFPAAMLALASAWKVTIMAELLSASGGLGDALAATRNTLDTAGTLALMGAMTAILIAMEFCVLEPVRKRVERWR